MIPAESLLEGQVPAQSSKSTTSDTADIAPLVDELRATGADFHHRGWSLGTSSNFSVRTSHSPHELLITASGKDKGRLRDDDFICVDDRGERAANPTHSFPTANKASAEVMLHVVITALPENGAVLHTHSVWGTLLSQRFLADGEIELSGYEMLKGLAGYTTHESTKRLKIFANTQDIAALADEVASLINRGQDPLLHGFLLAGHGLYAWGADLAEARRHIEVLEFLLECEGRRLSQPS